MEPSEAMAPVICPGAGLFVGMSHSSSQSFHRTPSKWMIGLNLEFILRFPQSSTELSLESCSGLQGRAHSLRLAWW